MNSIFANITGISGEGFREEVLGREARLWTEPWDVSSLFGWDVLNRILSSVPLVPPRIRLAGGHAAEPVTEWYSFGGSAAPRVVPQKLHHALNAGATLVVDHVDPFVQPVDQLARELSVLFGTTVQVNSYASLQGAPGFGAHTDDHDVIAIQISGGKTWKISGVGVPEGMPGEFDMLPGSVLYMPQGVEHDVSTHAEGSLHLTFAIPRPSYKEFMLWALQTLDTEELEKLVPPESTADTSSPVETWVNNALTEQAWNRFTRSRTNRGVLGGHVNLPFVRNEKDLVATGGGLIKGPEVNSGSHALDEVQKQILQSFDGPRRIGIDELRSAPNGDRLARDQALMQMVNDGWLRLVP